MQARKQRQMMRSTPRPITRFNTCLQKMQAETIFTSPASMPAMTKGETEMQRIVSRSLTSLMVLASQKDFTSNTNNTNPPMRSSEAEVRQQTLMIDKTPTKSLFLGSNSQTGSSGYWIIPEPVQQKDTEDQKYESNEEECSAQRDLSAGLSAEIPQVAVTSHTSTPRQLPQDLYNQFIY